MGNSQNTKPNNNLTLNIATLNFSAILKSPYQFYSAEDEEESRKRGNIELSLGKLFLKLIGIEEGQKQTFKKYKFDKKGNTVLKQLKKEVKKEMNEEGAQYEIQFEKQYEEVVHQFQWNLGKIDKHWQQTRYSPLYMETAGLRNKLYLQTRDQFLEEWQRRKSLEYGSLLKSYDKQRQSKIKKKQLLDQLPKDEKEDKKKQIKKLQSEIFDLSEQQLNVQLNNLMFFDMFAFEAIIVYLRGTPLEEFHKHFTRNKFNDDHKVQKSRRYRDFQKKKFSKTFLTTEKKLDHTIKILRHFDLDILFIQEANHDLVAEVEKTFPNYRIAQVLDPQTLMLSKRCQSVIIIKDRPQFQIRNLIEENNILRNNHKKLNLKNNKGEAFGKDDFQKLNISGKTIVQAIGNIILICPHLASNPQKNIYQMLQLKKQLLKLRQKFPECHIICAGDLNGQFLNPQDERQYRQRGYYRIPEKNQRQQQSMQERRNANNKFYVFPLEIITSNKMRTPLQVQRKKIIHQNKSYDKSGLKIKDYMISTLPIFDSKVLYLNKDMRKCVQINDKRLNQFQTNPPRSIPLPTDDHPYDHFLLIGKVKIPLPLIKVYHPMYKLKYTPSELSFHQIRLLKQEEERRGRDYFRNMTHGRNHERMDEKEIQEEISSQALNSGGQDASLIK